MNQMLNNIEQDTKRRDWKTQSVGEWENKQKISSIISKIERWFYQIKEVSLDLNIYNLNQDQFDCPNLFEFMVHMKLVENASLKYPIIINNEWMVIDWRHRICKAILKGDRTIKAIMILDSSVI